MFVFCQWNVRASPFLDVRTAFRVDLLQCPKKIDEWRPARNGRRKNVFQGEVVSGFSSSNYKDFSRGCLPLRRFFQGFASPLKTLPPLTTPMLRDLQQSAMRDGARPSHFLLFGHLSFKLKPIINICNDVSKYLESVNRFKWVLDFLHKFFADILILVQYFCGLFANPVYRAFVILC